ncbi:MAG TPA: hypothetical protein VGI81_04210 [Tepidisphaeraceae bacterium]
MEKFFSVLAEQQDGTTKLMPAKGNTPGDAFQQIKRMPGVRRVGKVREISPADYDALLHGREPVGMAVPARHDRHPAGSTAEPSPQPGRVDVHFKLKGPRIVLDARPTGGEQPFKNLNIPPERLKPYKPPQPLPPPAPVRPTAKGPPPPPPAAAPATQKDVAAPVQAEDAEAPFESTELEYRILKSRRAGGAPYILQRGHWLQQKGKRIFKVDWEKGFEHREKAEAHIDWVRRHAEELEAVSELVEG